MEMEVLLRYAYQYAEAGVVYLTDIGKKLSSQLLSCLSREALERADSEQAETKREMRVADDGEEIALHDLSDDEDVDTEKNTEQEENSRERKSVSDDVNVSEEKSKERKSISDTAQKRESKLSTDTQRTDTRSTATQSKDSKQEESESEEDESEEADTDSEDEDESSVMREPPAHREAAYSDSFWRPSKKHVASGHKQIKKPSAEFIGRTQRKRHRERGRECV